MMFGIYPIVAKHFKMFFGDVDNEFLNEVQSRNGFSNSFIVFVSGVMKGYIFAVLSINTRCGNNRSAEVSADVFNGDIRSAKIWLCTDIKAVSVFRVHFIFDFAKSRTNAGGKSFTIKKEIRKPLPLMNEGLGELRVSQTLFCVTGNYGEMFLIHRNAVLQ